MQQQIRREGIGTLTEAEAKEKIINGELCKR
jgi:hypothetical protein